MAKTVAKTCSWEKSWLQTWEPLGYPTAKIKSSIGYVNIHENLDISWLYAYK